MRATPTIMHALPSAEVIRLPVRLLVVPASPVLGRLLEDGTLDARQHAAAQAYAALRRRYDRAKHGGGGLAPGLWSTVKRDHAKLIRSAGAAPARDP